MLFEIERTNIILYCQNWEETTRFYQHTLQLSSDFQTDWFIEFQINANTYLSVADERKASIKSASGKGLTLSWQVKDINDTHNRLRMRGLTVSALQEKWGALVCYFFDPEGNRIELWEAIKT